MTAWPDAGRFPAILAVTQATVTDVLAYGWYMALAWGADYAHADDEDSDRPFGVDVAMARRVMVAWDGLALFCEELGVTVDQALAQCVPGDFVRPVVEFAQTILEHEENFARWLATDVCEYQDDELERVVEEREARITERREAAVREYANLLRQLWEMVVVGG